MFIDNTVKPSIVMQTHGIVFITHSHTHTHKHTHTLLTKTHNYENIFIDDKGDKG